MQKRTLGWGLAATLLLAHAATAAEDGAAARRVTLDDGTEVALTVQGSGPPLVFIHGWACNRTHWREQIPVFAADHTVVALDLPGHGESTGTRATWTVAQYGDDVAAVVRKLGLDHVVLVGHSMGGPVALEAARRLGSTVAGIVVVDTLQNVEMRMEGKQIDAVLEAYRKDWAGTCAMAVPRMFVPSADPELVKWVTGGMCATRPEVAVGLFEGFAALDEAATMKAVSAPIRAINAQWQPTAVEVNRKYSPGFDVTVIDGVGHFIQLEAPERFNQALRQTLLAFDDAPAARQAAAAPLGPVITTALGPVQGRVDDGIHAFKGLRYAAAPTGANRFKPPGQLTAWKSAADASKYGAPCVQMATGNSANPSTELSKQIATIFTTSTEMKIASEDCLFLNLWTPGTEGKRPVMVWLHGGGFAYGSGSWPVYDGHNLAKKGDVVVVTVNHRLNVFGYLYLGELGPPGYEKSGNAGMLDLVAALEWVRDNVARFGGDPGNVTIFGESGGGAKVSTLMAMPAASGLFHKAIVESGPGLRSTTKEGAGGMAKLVLEALAIAPTDAAALAAAPTEKVLSAAFAAAEKVSAAARFNALAPVVDGVVLDRHPFDPDAPAISAGVPLLIGWNKDEMALFNASEPWWGKLSEDELAKSVTVIAGGEDKGKALLAALRELRPGYSPTYLRSSAATASFMFLGSVQQAERKAAQNQAPVYVYELVWETPIGNGIFKSPHTLEIPFVFANVDKAAVLVGSGDAPAALERQMSDAWIAFARTGNPNTAGLPEWPRYDATRRATMVFDTTSRVVDDPDRAIREALAP